MKFALLVTSGYTLIKMVRLATDCWLLPPTTLCHFGSVLEMQASKDVRYCQNIGRWRTKWSVTICTKVPSCSLWMTVMIPTCMLGPFSFTILLSFRSVFWRRLPSSYTPSPENDHDSMTLTVQISGLKCERHTRQAPCNKMWREVTRREQKELYV